MKQQRHVPRRLLSLLLVVVMALSLVPSAFAAQDNSYHDPAEHWMEALNRTNELDANAIVTHETFRCTVCGQNTSFTVWRVPEYTRDGVTALSRNVLYSDGTMVDGEGKGTILDGIPGVDAYYTGWHWTKACCETCGTINSNAGTDAYDFNRNVYILYDCAAEFMEDLDETVTYAYGDSTYHTKTVTGGTYCVFCYGTRHTEQTTLERHDLATDILPQPTNGRFAVVESCSLCDDTRYDYVAAKSVVANYYGEANGRPHTVTVSDLSDAGVTTQIRYGNSADGCTLTSAPSYVEAGAYPVYYEITYTYKGESMTEHGVAYVHLYDASTTGDGSCACGCGDVDCGCQAHNCEGTCCTDGSCVGKHNWTLLDSTPASCLTLGYDRYLCTECGRIEKRDYTAPIGHAWQNIVIRESTCEADGKVLQICANCGQAEVAYTDKGEHRYSTYSVAATCTSPGYTVRECSVCGERHIENITPVLAHDYVSTVTPVGCESGGHTTHICYGCGSSFVTDYTDPLGHSWDEGTLIADATCTGEGVLEYRCTRCGDHRLAGDPAAGHVPGQAATCTEPQLCSKCGAVLVNALGHDYTKEVTAFTCTDMGYTTYTCSRCGDSYRGDYTDAVGHTPSEWIVDQAPTTDSAGRRHRECEICGETLEAGEIEKIYMQATTDTHGEALVGGYLVLVTDTNTANPVVNATVTLHADDTLSVLLPSDRLLNYADQTTITVQLMEDKSAVAGMHIAVTDKRNNYCEDITDSAGQITIPTASCRTSGDGSATIGYTDEAGDRWTLTVTVEDHETGRPIEDAQVSVGKSGNITVVLPDGTDMDENNRITITVTDNKRKAQEDMTVIVKGDLGQRETGVTDTDGKLTVPAVMETEYHGAYIVGYPDGNFGPERSMSRSEAAAIFARLLADKLGESIYGGSRGVF